VGYCIKIVLFLRITFLNVKLKIQTQHIPSDYYTDYIVVSDYLSCSEHALALSLFFFKLKL